MARIRFRVRLVHLVIVTSAVAAACASSEDGSSGDEETPSEAQVDEALSAGRSITLYYLGSSHFLRSCAGNTLGCGRAVSSVPDAHPYFSAPWSHSRCNDWY